VEQRLVRKRKREQSAQRKKMQRVINRSLLIFLGVILLIFFIHQAYSFALTHAVRTVVAELGNLSADFQAQAISFCDEKVILAPQAGTLVREAADGQLVRNGSVVAKLQPPAEAVGSSVVNVTAPQPGYVRYALDGWEGVLVPDSWQKLNLPALFDKVAQKKQTVSSHSYQAGSPLCKIVNSLVDPLLVIKISTDSNRAVAVGDNLELNWDNQGSGRARVLKVTEHDGYRLAIVNLYLMGRLLPAQRLFNLRVYDLKYQGTVVPSSSLAKEGGKSGLYIQSAYGIRFSQVHVLGSLGDKTAVSGLTPGTEVVTNPGIARRIGKM
jgi:putative membrane fusion protein